MDYRDIQQYNKIKLEIDVEEGELIAQEELYDYIHGKEPQMDFEEMNPDNIETIRFNDFGIISNDGFEILIRLGATVRFKDQLMPISQFMAEVRVGYSGLNIRGKGRSKVERFYRYTFQYE